AGSESSRGGVHIIDCLAVGPGWPKRRSAKVDPVGRVISFPEQIDLVLERARSERCRCHVHVVDRCPVGPGLVHVNPLVLTWISIWFPSTVQYTNYHPHNPASCIS